MSKKDDELRDHGSKTRIVGGPEVLKDVLDYWEEGRPTTYDLPWPSIQEHYSVARNQLQIVTGIPGHGKSILVKNIAIHMAKQHDWKFLVYSGEDVPYPELYADLLTVYSGKPFGDGPNERISEKEAEKYLKDFFNQHFKVIDPGDNIAMLGDLVNKLKKTDDFWDLDGFILDPWNDLDNEIPSGMRQDMYLKKILSRFRRIAQMRDLSIWIVAHPKTLEDHDTAPNIYSVSGGSMWANKCDVQMAIYRPDIEDNLSEIYIQKVRRSWMGTPGIVDLRFNTKAKQFYEPGGNQRESSDVDTGRRPY